MHVNTINTLNWHCFIVLSCGVHAVHTDQARNQTTRACGHHSPTQSDTPLFVVFVTTLARLRLSWQVDHITSLRRYAAPDCQLPAFSGLRIITAETKMVMSRPGDVCLISSHTTTQQHNISRGQAFVASWVQMRSYVLYHVWCGARVRIQSTNNQINKTKCMHVNQICKCLDPGAWLRSLHWNPQ